MKCTFLCSILKLTQKNKEHRLSVVIKHDLSILPLNSSKLFLPHLNLYPSRAKHSLWNIQISYIQKNNRKKLMKGEKNGMMNGKNIIQQDIATKETKKTSEVALIIIMQTYDNVVSKKSKQVLE